MPSMGPVGNVYDKYGTRNPVARALMRGFLDAVGSLYGGVRPRSVLEVGCGEGKLALHLHALGHERGAPPERFEITDVDLGRIGALPEGIVAREASIYDLPYPDRSFDLVVCCEVLEHLERPDAGFDEVVRVAKDRVLLSTPREPLWRVLNVARGKYLRALGNTPGHVQHWSRRGLVQWAEARLRVLRVESPLPWTIVLGEPLR